ncbi:MAG: SIS domain-containing protein [archaeon]
MEIKSFAQNYLDNLKAAIDGIDLDELAKVADAITTAYQGERQIFILGNGGSASTASHMACDLGKGTLMNRYDTKEKRYRVIALTDNIPLMTAYANDLSYEDIFSQQLRNLVQKDDLVIAISASGNSPNVIKAVDVAQEAKAIVIGFSGFTGGKLLEKSDICLHVNQKHYGRVEDLHLVFDHLLTEFLSSLKEKEA